MNAIFETINAGLDKAFRPQIVRTDTTKDGYEVETIKNERGQLEHRLKKQNENMQRM